jgi:hypothetical protein
MTSTDNTPEIYRKWSAITMVAGAMEERVWTIVGSRSGKPRATFPNLYILLVGAPGVGKLIVEDVQSIWSEVKLPNTDKRAFHVAPTNMSKAALMDTFSQSLQTFLPPTGPPFEYHSLLVAAEEFGVFFPNYDQDFIGVLNRIYMVPPDYVERRRHGPAREIILQRPVMSLIGGTQPAWLGSVFPNEAWGTGLTSRIIFIYASSGDPSNPFEEGHDRPIERVRLLGKLGKISELYGELKWDKVAANYLAAWHMSGGKPTPTHSRLEHYIRRRTLHVIKLCIISSVSRTNKIGTIEQIDVERAIAWLTEAEKVMPDIFRAMEGNSDFQVIEELYHFLVRLYNAARQSPIPEKSLYSFLITKVPSEKIEKILLAAERSHMIDRVGGTDTFIPKARVDFVE